MFDPSLFWPSAAKSGLLAHPYATATIGGIDRDAAVDSIAPDVLKLSGASRSTEYEIEYQAADWPGLAQGDIVKLWDDATKTTGRRFRVREPSYVPDDPARARSGYWRCALLTFEATL